MEYIFELPIGDFLGDGHNKIEYFIVKSNKSVEEVKEIHKRGCKEVFDSICKDYREFKIKTLEDLPEWARSYFGTYGYINSDQLAKLWVEMLRRTDPDLNIYLIMASSTLDVEANVGYGLFD